MEISIHQLCAQYVFLFHCPRGSSRTVLEYYLCSHSLRPVRCGSRKVCVAVSAPEMPCSLPDEGGAAVGLEGRTVGPLQLDPSCGPARDPRTRAHRRDCLGPSLVSESSPPPHSLLALLLHQILSPPQGRPALDGCGEFGFCDSTVDSEHSPQRSSSQSQAISLSLCGPSGSWSVYTKLQAREENLQPYRRTKGAGPAAGGMCVSLASFPAETFGLV